MNTTTQTTPRGETITNIRKGNKLATITEEHNGSLRVALFIDYGDDGRNYCDGATYKTRAGAMRKVNGFVK